MENLSPETYEKLKHYVYLLADPDNQVFYVGRGQGNRIYSHVNGTLTSDDKNDKMDKIREIHKKGKKVKHFILRHALEESEVKILESAIIEYINYFASSILTNQVQGYHANEYGLMTIEDIKSKYEATPLKDGDINDEIMLININKTYFPNIREEALYEATRKHWPVRKTLKKTKILPYVCSVYRGVIIEVFKAFQWKDSPHEVKTSEEGKDRLYFDGEVAPDEIRNKYRFKSVREHFAVGKQFPIQME